MANKCEYSFSPEKWDEKHEKVTTVADRWECNRDVHVDGKCIFHAPPETKSDELTRDRLLEEINNAGEGPKHLIGLKTGDLDLDSRLIDCPDGHPIKLQHSEIRGILNLRKTDIRQEIYFTNSVINKLSLNRATIRDIDFYASNIGTISAPRAKLGHINFSGCIVGKGFFFASEFKEGFFTNARFTSCSDFRSTTFEEMVFIKTGAVKDDIILDLSKSNIKSGEIRIPEDGGIFYDFTQATLGMLDLKSDRDEYSELFEHFLIKETNFDGFDFTPYRQYLSPDWIIHTLNHSSINTVVGSPSIQPIVQDLENVPPEILERTYSKASSGAALIGDRKAASEFFMKEMHFSRGRYAKQMGDEAGFSKFILFTKFVRNTILNWSCGYGERPSRVVILSITSIIVFAEIFGVLIPKTGDNVSHIMSSYILSLQAFVSLVFGTDGEAVQPLVKLVAGIEGFFGAFLIALFVFTLTRSIHR